MKKTRFEKEMYEKHFRVAIFGSARIKEGDPRYNLVYKLAKKIAADNIDIVTGGGPGLMEAASKGHKEGRKGNHSHSLGLNIKLPTEQKSNRHLDIKKEFHKFSERLDTFAYLSNVVVVAPGGLGTSLELFYIWQLIQVKNMCDVPVILIGDMWADLLKWVKKWPLKRNLMKKSDLESIFVAKNVNEAMKIIKRFHKAYLEGREEHCANVKKLKLK